jgi:hypothetical protein
MSNSNKPPPFPWRTHTNEELYRDFSELRKRIFSKTPSLTIDKPLVGYKSSNAFFQKERLRVRSQRKPSAIEYWNKNYKYIISFDSIQDLFGRTVFLSFAASQFSPYVAGVVYRYFMETVFKTSPEDFTVFDPYAGWGDRCLASLACNVNYIGCDMNTRLVSCYKKMLRFFDKETESSYKLFFQPSETLDMNTINADILFTSPPFYSKLKGLVEEYSGTERNYKKFMEKSLIPIVKKSLDKRMWVCLYIPDNMYEDLVKIFGKSKKTFTFRSKINNMNARMSNTFSIYCWKK